MANVADVNAVVAGLTQAVQGLSTAVGGLISAFTALKMNAIDPASLDPVVSTLGSLASQVTSITDQVNAALAL